MTGVASAAFNTWIGSDSTAWATATNWSRGSVPATSSPYDNVGLPDYSNSTGYPEGKRPCHFRRTNSQPFRAGDGPPKPPCPPDLTVNGNLILENDLTLNNQEITLGPVGYLIEDNGLLVGSSASDTGTITTTRSHWPSLPRENVGGLGAQP